MPTLTNMINFYKTKLNSPNSDSVAYLSGKRKDTSMTKTTSEYLENKRMFKTGDKVEKVGGDYTFVGIVVSVFEKVSGVTRLVVEDDRGVLHVYGEKILRHVE